MDRDFVAVKRVMEDGDYYASIEIVGDGSKEDCINAIKIDILDRETEKGFFGDGEEPTYEAIEIEYDFHIEDWKAYNDGDLVVKYTDASTDEYEYFIAIHSKKKLYVINKL